MTCSTIWADSLLVQRMTNIDQFTRDMKVLLKGQTSKSFERVSSVKYSFLNLVLHVL